MPKIVRTVKATAAFYDVDEETVKHWIKTKQLPAFNVCKSPGGSKPRWRIYDDDMDAFLATRGNRPATTQQAATTKPRRKTVATGKQWI